LRPVAGNILLTTTPTFTGNADVTFFDKTVSYIGAFGSTDWTTGWCNFDPQNTDY